jgi:SAM-dependent methyltransferase
MTGAAYDAHASWYANYVKGRARPYTERVAVLLRELLGPGQGICVDVGCGTGVFAQTLRKLGWTPVGFDLSVAQLRYAQNELPVAAADASCLPLADSSARSVVATLIHTDVEDWSTTLREAARVLQPGCRFVYIGVHPCFVGPFARRTGGGAEVTAGYAETGLQFEGHGLGDGIRSRVGVRHRTLSEVLNAAPTAGLRLEKILEAGPAVPDLLGFAATAPPPEK